MTIHPCRPAFRHLLGESLRGQADNRHLRSRRRQAADPSRRFKTIHLGHPNIHQNHIEILRFRCDHGHPAVIHARARGIVVSYETVREWGLRFGRLFANELKRRRPRPGDKWYLDEVFIRIRGKLHYLWRAVDQHGHVLDILVQSRRNAKAAKRFFRKLLRGPQYVPRVIVTDKLRSYGAAKREILPGVEHRQSRYLNNQAEVSHQPTRRRERQVQRFR